MNDEDKAIEEMEIYNEKQQFYVKVRDNCIATLKQFDDSIQLQKDIEEMAERKIKEFAD